MEYRVHVDFRRAAVWSAVAAFGVLLVRRVGVGLDPPGRTLFGDTGDGFFNLWILEHVRMNLLRGWGALSDGRMLHPTENTFWFSDNLLALSPPYWLARAAGGSRLAAGYWTHVFWLTAQFAATWFLFSEVRKSVGGRFPRFGKSPPGFSEVRKTGEGVVPRFGSGLDPLAPWWAVVVTFVPARMWSLQHFQNHALGIWIVLWALAIRQGRTRRVGALWAMAAVWVALLASNPYYAVLGIFVWVGWGAAVLSDPEVEGGRLLRRAWPGLVVSGLAAAPLAFAYWRAGVPAFAEEELLRRAWRWQDVLPPAWGGHAHGYTGLWGLWAGLGVGGVWLWRARRGVGGLLRRREVWVLAGLGAVSMIKAREIYPVTVWLRIAVQVGAVAGWAAWCRKRGGVAARAVLMLGLTLILVAGTAMGPGSAFGEGYPDTSVWGLASAVIPGVRGMRELIRFAPAVAVCGAAMVFAGAVSFRGARVRRAVAGLLCLAVGFGLFESRGAWAGRMEIEPERLALSEAQVAFFGGLEGAMLVIPCAPFHGNPESMLLWQRFRGLRLLNGYSGRLPEGFAELIRVENHHGRGSMKLPEAARAAGADWICFRKDWMRRAEREAFAEAYPVVYQDGRFLVLGLADH